MRAQREQDDGIDPLGPREGYDWSLGAKNPFLFLLRWGLVLLFGLGAFGCAALALIPTFAALASGTSPPDDVGGAFALTSTGVGIVGAIFVNYAVGPGGWWGRAANRLADEMSSSTGSVRGTLPLISGLRAPQSRASLLLAAPYRLVVVSRGWDSRVLGVLFVWAAAGIALTDFTIVESAFQSVFMNAFGMFFCAVILGHRVELHEIPWGDLESVTVRKSGFHLVVTGGPLAPGFRYRPFSDQRQRFLSGLLQYRPDLVPSSELASDVSGEVPPPPDAVPPDDAVAERLSRLQQRWQED